MKIIHLTFSLLIGGAESLLIDIANNQCEKHEITIIILNKCYRKDLLSAISPSIKVICLNRLPGDRLNILPFLRFWSILVRIQPSVIQCHHPRLIYLVQFWKSIVFITVHDVGISIKDIGKYSNVISISNAVRDDLIQRGNLISTVVFNGIDFSSFVKRSNYKSASDAFRIIQVSRLIHQKKGQDIAIKAIHRLITEYGWRNVKLHFVGEGASQHYLENLSRQLDLEDNIQFLGEKDRKWIRENLCKYDLLIQPSVYEGFGLTLLEAIAAGIPVIANKIDGPAEILQDLPTGFLCNPEREHELDVLIKRVKRLYENGQIQLMCLESISLAQQKYSIQSTSVGYLKQYDELLNPSAHYNNSTTQFDRSS